MATRAKIVGVFLLSLAAGLFAGAAVGFVLYILMLPLAEAQPPGSVAAEIIPGIAAFIGLAVAIVVAVLVNGAWDYEHGVDI